MFRLAGLWDPWPWTPQALALTLPGTHNIPQMRTRKPSNIGAYIITNTILGVPYHNHSIIYHQTLF